MGYDPEEFLAFHDSEVADPFVLEDTGCIVNTAVGRDTDYDPRHDLFHGCLHWILATSHNLLEKIPFRDNADGVIIFRNDQAGNAAAGHNGSSLGHLGSAMDTSNILLHNFRNASPHSIGCQRLCQIG